MCGGRLDDRLALGLRGVAGAEGGADAVRGVAQLAGDLLDLGERGFEVALDVVAERLERRDVDDLDFVGERPFSASRMRRSMATRKAASVLPEPVGAAMRVSRPAMISGQPTAWASVGARNCARTRCGRRGGRS